MTRAIALVVFLAFGAQAQESDAPTEISTDGGYSVRLLPLRGSDEERIAIAKAISACYAENEDLKSEVKKQMHPAVFVLIVVGAAVAGGFIGYGISKLPPPK